MARAAIKKREKLMNVDNKMIDLMKEKDPQLYKDLHIGKSPVLFGEGEGEGKNIPEWRKKEKHRSDVQLALNKSNSTLRGFYGEKYWQYMNELNHTSMDFNKCICGVS